MDSFYLCVMETTLIDRLPCLPFQQSFGDWVAVQWIDACGVQICSMTRKEVRVRGKPGSPTLQELRRGCSTTVRVNDSSPEFSGKVERSSEEWLPHFRAIQLGRWCHSFLQTGA